MKCPLIQGRVSSTLTTQPVKYLQTRKFTFCHDSEPFRPWMSSRRALSLITRGKGKDIEYDEYDDDWGRNTFNYEEELEKKFPGSNKPLQWDFEEGAEPSGKKKLQRPWERKESRKPKEVDSKGETLNRSISKAKINSENTKEKGVTHGDQKHQPSKEVQKFEYKAERRRAKTPPVKPQVTFSEPFSRDCEVAIIGGGISGIMCALTLAEDGIRSTIFDTGKHGLGGRLATRKLVLASGESVVFDHAAQFFTASSPDFRAVVHQWQEQGLIKEWNGLIGTLKAGGGFSELPNETRYTGVGGMRQLCDDLAKRSPLISIRRPVWVSDMEVKGEKWALRERNVRLGEFGAVVIAHNGKCANRLLSPAGVPSIAKQMRRLELSAIWALLAAFDSPLPIPSGLLESGVPAGTTLEGAFVEGIPAVTWMANNTAKLAGQVAESDSSSLECWTVFSSKEFGRSNKVPQEAIPKARANKVQAAMLGGMETALGLSPGELPVPVFSKLQLWGAALPLNAPGTECILDAIGRVGICGDWLLAPSIEGAVLSGIALGKKLTELAEHGGLNDELSVGLDTKFLPVGGHDIGDVLSTNDSRVEESEVLIGV